MPHPIRQASLEKEVISMGFFITRERLFKRSGTRFAFLLIGAAAFAVTEFGRFICRPYVQEKGINDFGLTDSIGNFGGIVVQIFLGLALMNATRRQSYRLATFFIVGYVLYEFAQPVLPRGVFDWNDVYGTIIGFLFSVLVLTLMWRLMPFAEQVHDSSEKKDSTIA